MNTVVAPEKLQLCIQMHFVQIKFRAAVHFLLLHIAAQSHQTDTAPEVPIDVPLKALIKFSQSNQIRLKSLFAFSAHRSGSRTDAPSFGSRSGWPSRRSRTPAPTPSWKARTNQARPRTSSRPARPCPTSQRRPTRVHHRISRTVISNQSMVINEIKFRRGGRGRAEQTFTSSIFRLAHAPGHTTPNEC